MFCTYAIKMHKFEKNIGYGLDFFKVKKQMAIPKIVAKFWKFMV